MELTAKLLPQLIELHKWNVKPLIFEAYAQKDFDSIRMLESAQQTKSFHYIEQFYLAHGWKLARVKSWHKAMLNSKVITKTGIK